MLWLDWLDWLFIGLFEVFGQFDWLLLGFSRSLVGSTEPVTVDVLPVACEVLLGHLLAFGLVPLQDELVGILKQLLQDAAKVLFALGLGVLIRAQSRHQDVLLDAHFSDLAG